MSHFLAGRWRYFQFVPVGPPSWADWTVTVNDDAAWLTCVADDGRVVSDQSATTFYMAACQGVVRRIDDHGRVSGW